MKKILTPLFALAASPALAATGPFFSLGNTDFVVMIAFAIFLGILLYYKVPSKVGEMLDRRAALISAELNEAKALREEAQSLLASYERKQAEVQGQADRIVANAKAEAQDAAAAAKDDIAKSIQRRLAAAEDQIANAQSAAVKEVRDQAVAVAVAAAREVLAKQMTPGRTDAMIDSSIETVKAKLH